MPVVWRSTPSTRSICGLYAVDAKHLLPSTRYAVVWPSATPSTVTGRRAHDKNRAQFEGTHATLAKHRQRRPQRDARRREPTDAAACDCGLGRAHAAAGSQEQCDEQALPHHCQGVNGARSRSSGVLGCEL